MPTATFLTSFEQRHSFAGKTLSPIVSITSESIVSISETVQISVEKTIPINIDVSEVLSFFVVVDEDAQLRTVAGGGSGTNIDLKANVPYIWIAAAPYEAFQYIADLTELFVEGHDTLVNRVQIEVASNVE